MKDPRIPIETAGARLVFAHSVPWEVLDRCLPLLRAIALEAPPTVGAVVVITSTHRTPKPGESFTWHHAGFAIDWRSGIKPDRLTGELGAIVASSRDMAIAILKSWVERVRARVGNEYDIVGPPDPRHLDHGHGEHDGRKAARVFLEK